MGSICRVFVGRKDLVMVRGVGPEQQQWRVAYKLQDLYVDHRVGRGELDVADEPVPIYVKPCTFVLGPNASSGILSIAPGRIKLERGGPQFFRPFYRVREVVDTHDRVSITQVRVGIPGTLSNLLVVGREHTVIAALARRDYAQLREALREAGFEMTFETRWFRRGRGRTF
jgi:hypothetical protein